MSQAQNKGSTSFHLPLRNYLSLKGVLFVGISLILLLSFISHTDSMFTSKSALPMALDNTGMENNIEYRQIIPYQEGEIKAFQIQFGTYGRLNKGLLKVSVLRGSQVLQSWEVDTVRLVDNAFIKFELASPVLMTKDVSYFLVLKDQYDSGANNIAFYTSRDANKIEYNGSVLGNRSFSVIYETGNLSQKALYQRAIAIFLFLGIVFLSLLVNPKSVKVRSYVFLLLCGLLCIRVLDYNLFQNLSKTDYISDWKQSQKTDTIAPQASKQYRADLSHAYFDTFKVYPEGENRKNIHIRIVKDGGAVYFDDDIGLPYIIGEGRTNRTAALAYRQEKFTPGMYTVEIRNTGDRPLQISVLDNGDLNFGLSNHTFLSGKIALYVLAVLFAYVLVMFALLSSRQRLSAEKWFLVTAIPLAAIYLVLFTPWSQPDTHAHMFAGYRLSNILLGYPEEDLWKGRKEDSEFIQYAWYAKNVNERNPGLESYSSVAKYAHLKCESDELVPLPGSEEKMKFYSIFNYLPQVLGFTLGRLLNLSAFVSMYLGKLFILALYIGIFYRNIKKIPCGRWIMATVALFPMPLMMSTSVSYDAMVIISSFSFIACSFRLMAEKSKCAYFEAAAWAFIAGAVKGGGYVLILLPLLFISFDRNNKKASLHKIAGLAAVGVFSVLLFDKILPAKTGFQFGTEGNYKLTAAFAFHEPLRYLDMALNSYLTYFDGLAFNAAGASLAIVEWTLPAILVILFAIIGGVLAVFEKDDIALCAAHKWIFILVIIIGLSATPAMLLSWTNAGSVRVEGLQGRYFLPLVPLFYYIQTKFSLYTPGKNNSALIIRKGILWMSVMSCVFVYYIMTLYLTR